VAAEAASAGPEAVFLDEVPDPPDQDLLTAGAGGVLSGVPRHVAQINVVEALRQGDIATAFQGGHRCGRQVLQFVHGMEAAEVQGHLRAQVLFHPRRHALDLARAIVQRGNHQVDDLQPHLFALQHPQRVQDRLQFGAADGAVVFLGERFQVHLHRTDLPAQFPQRLFQDIGAGDDDRMDPLFPGQDRGVISVFVEDYRLGIRERNGPGPRPLGLGHHAGRGKVDVFHLFRPYLRDVPVLTELALHTTAGGGQGEGQGAGQEMEERFLFDGVHMHGAGLPIDQGIVPPPFILAGGTVTAFDVVDAALPGAELTLYPLIVQLLIMLGLVPGELPPGRLGGRMAHHPAQDGRTDSRGHGRTDRLPQKFPAGEFLGHTVTSTTSICCSSQTPK